MVEISDFEKRLPAAIEKLQKTNELAAKQAQADAEKQAAKIIELKKTVSSTTTGETTPKDRLAARRELAEISSNTQLAAEKAASTSNAAIKMRESLEEQGQIATDSKKYLKLNYKAEKETLDERLKNPELSKSAKKEIEEERRALMKKDGTRLEKIGLGITNLFNQGKEMAKKAMMVPALAMLGVAMGAAMYAIGEFLQSETFQKMLKYIKENIMPAIENFWNDLKDNWEGVAVFIVSVLAAFVIFKAIMIGAKIVQTIQAIGVAFGIVKAFFASTMLPAITSMMVPLLPFIAIAAAIGLVLYALWTAFEDFETTLEETGSIGEALKVGVSKFMAFLIAWPASLMLKLVGWVAGIFGFDDFKKKVDAIDPIQLVADTIKGLFDKLFAWFGLLFKDPVKAMKDLVKGFFGGFLNIADWLVDMIKKPLVWLLGLFGWDDAAAAVETFSLKGFVMETWNKVKCWFISLFSWAAKEDSGDSWLVKTIKGVITGVKEWFELLFSDPVPAIKKAIGGYISLFTDFGGFIYRKAVKPVIDWVGGLFGMKKGEASKGIEDWVGDKLSKITNFAGAIYDKYIAPVVKWVSDLFGGSDEKGGAGGIKWPDLGGMMPDLPTWDNIKGKIGNLLNDMLQGLAKMVDVWAIPDGVSKAFASMGVTTAGALGVSGVQKYNPSEDKMELVDTETGEVTTQKKLDELQKSKIAREAKQDAGGGAPVNVDARQDRRQSNVLTGPSGVRSITKKVYGAANAGGYVPYG
jgi:hypothetical protein